MTEAERALLPPVRTVAAWSKYFGVPEEAFVEAPPGPHTIEFRTPTIEQITLLRLIEQNIAGDT